MLYLQRCFPTSFDVRQEWLAKNPQQVPIEWGDVSVNPASFAIGVVNLARLAQCDTILPAALAVCCCLGSVELVDGFAREDGSRERLSEVDLKRCIAGVRGLAHAASAMVINALAGFNRHDCKTRAACHRAIRELLADHTNDDAYFPMYNPFRNWDSWLAHHWNDQGACAECLAEVKQRFRDEQRRMWAKLPHIFRIAVEEWGRGSFWQYVHYDLCWVCMA